MPSNQLDVVALIALHGKVLPTFAGTWQALEIMLSQQDLVLINWIALNEPPKDFKEFWASWDNANKKEFPTFQIYLQVGYPNKKRTWKTIITRSRHDGKIILDDNRLNTIFKQQIDKIRKLMEKIEYGDKE